jgi:hypothetical protein
VTQHAAGEQLLDALLASGAVSVNVPALRTPAPAINVRHQCCYHAEQYRGRHGTCSTQLLTAKSGGLDGLAPRGRSPPLVLSDLTHRVTLWIHYVTHVCAGRDEVKGLGARGWWR